jgi:mRNA interferase MazF
VVAPAYVPDAGDLIWLDFDPQAGREQAGRRPALVLSPSAYNRKTSLAVVCPITSQAKGYPFEVELQPAAAIRGVVLADHLKNLDWRRRRAEKAGRASPQTMALVRERTGALLGIA